MGKKCQGKFHAWIKSLGYAETARRLKTSRQRVRQWVSEKRTPDIRSLARILIAGRGAFTLDDIINDSTK